MSIIYTILTGEVLAEVFDENVESTLKELIQQDHNKNDLRIMPSPPLAIF